MITKYKQTIGIILCALMGLYTVNAEMLQTSLSVGVNSPKSVSQTESTNVSVDSHDIAPYGEMRNVNNVNIFSSIRLVNIDSNPFIYGQAYYDTESGFNYMKARYQNPILMRFISQDSKDLKNPYAYGNGDPINNFDPTGHDAWTILGYAVSWIPLLGNAYSIVHGAIVKDYLEVGLGAGFAYLEGITGIYIYVKKEAWDIALVDYDGSLGRYLANNPNKKCKYLKKVKELGNGSARQTKEIDVHNALKNNNGFLFESYPKIAEHHKVKFDSELYTEEECSESKIPILLNVINKRGYSKFIVFDDKPELWKINKDSLKEIARAMDGKKLQSLQLDIIDFKLKLSNGKVRENETPHSRIIINNPTSKGKI